HRRFIRLERLASGSPLRGRARSVPVAQLLESAINDLPSKAPAMRRGISTTHADERSRPGAVGLRLSFDVSRCRPGPFHARIRSAARWARAAWHYAHERRKPHRTGRLYRRGPGTTPSNSTRPN